MEEGEKDVREGSVGLRTLVRHHRRREVEGESVREESSDDRETEDGRFESGGTFLVSLCDGSQSPISFYSFESTKSGSEGERRETHLLRLFLLVPHTQRLRKPQSRVSVHPHTRVSRIERRNELVEPLVLVRFRGEEVEPVYYSRVRGSVSSSTRRWRREEKRADVPTQHPNRILLSRHSQPNLRPLKRSPPSPPLDE